jgi:ribonucleoside-diphosphate reductase alpha chain
MFRQNIAFDTWGSKYQLKDHLGNAIEKTPKETCERVSRALANIETKDKDYWYEQFMSIMGTRFAGGGRIMANVGAEKYKKETSPINCTVMRQIPDSMAGIMDIAKEAALTLKAGCGVGYDFSTIRPKGAFVYGAGAETSGVISFMKIFDAVCSTVLSGGARRGAQMACLDISSPEIEEFITEKRKDGALRYFNCSVLITDIFMEAVESDGDWSLWFWQKQYDGKQPSPDKIKIIRKDDIPYNHPEYEYFSFAEDHNEVTWKNCIPKDIFKKIVYKTVKAKYLFELITKSTYNFWEPGFILIDRINAENNLYFCETIRALNPCGEQGLHPLTSCLLGSMILTKYVKHPFEKTVSFDFAQLTKDVRIASRALDNVVELNNLPIPEMQTEILKKRRHGLGFTGLGSALNMMNMAYGSNESLELAEKIQYTLAEVSLLMSIELAKEKGCATIFNDKDNRIAVCKSGFMQRLLASFDSDTRKQIKSDILEHGLRYSHATSVAPTGTMSMSWGDYCSGGIEPVLSDTQLRNIRSPKKKTKIQEEVFDYAFFLWKDKFENKKLPPHWRTTNDLKVEDHMKMQSVIQKWCDSSISKTVNVPVDYSFEDFKNIYMRAWKLGLKGMTTYRPNPEVSSGVIMQKKDLENTEYSFTLEDGTEVILKGSEQVEYDGETHNVANLFDALKEGLYGRM